MTEADKIKLNKWQRVFVNRSLNMAKLRSIGFDITSNGGQDGTRIVPANYESVEVFKKNKGKKKSNRFAKL